MISRRKTNKMSDYQHYSERTLPKPIHGHIKTSYPDLSHRNGDIKVIRLDGTEYTISSKDAAQIEYERSQEERRTDAVKRQSPESIPSIKVQDWGVHDKPIINIPIFGRD
jgi:hypothetical protein